MEGLKNSMSTATAGPATSQPPNHLDIHNSIDNIRAVVSQLDDLKATLNNDDRKGLEPTQEATTPSFIEVLNHTATNIRNECDKANEIIDEIRAMLLN